MGPQKILPLCKSIPGNNGTEKVLYTTQSYRTET